MHAKKVEIGAQTRSARTWTQQSTIQYLIWKFQKKLGGQVTQLHTPLLEQQSGLYLA